MLSKIMAATSPWFVALLLAAALPGALGTVAQWDCTTHPYPVQVLKETGDSQYKTMQLNLIEKRFTEMWPWTVNTAQQPTKSLNAQAYNINDGIAYGIFSPDDADTSSSIDSYLCRFDHVQDSVECLCKAPQWGYSATITSDGAYYFTTFGGASTFRLPAVHNIAYPTGSPADVNTLSDCGFTAVAGSGLSTGGAIDVSSSGLTVAMMEAAYGGVSSDCTTNCYMSTQGYGGIWTKSGSNMATWRPGGQTYNDIIDWEYNGRTYLIGVGYYDGSVYMGRLDAGGSGNLDGYAFSRVEVDYTQAPSGTTKLMQGFGAG